MAFDIYGNTLRGGHCEVHPHVHQEYPCDLCMGERRRSLQLPDPLCDICKKSPACADTAGYRVCSEGCAHEAIDRRATKETADRAAELLESTTAQNARLVTENARLRAKLAELSPSGPRDESSKGA